MIKRPRLPDFLILGAAKAGTTAMFRSLARHPSIHCPVTKEPRFFAFAGQSINDLGPDAGLLAETTIIEEAEYYRLFENCPAGKLTGEASPVYLSSERSPGLAHQYVPHAKLIVILRHPVERAYSQWLERRHSGMEPLADFESAWNAEDERLAAGWSFFWAYRQRGFYAKQIEHWLEYFPREQLLILFHEDWKTSPRTTLAQVCSHLGLPYETCCTASEEHITSLRPRWAWLHHQTIRNNRVRRLAQRFLPLPWRDQITNTIRSWNLSSGETLDPTLRARLAKVYHGDLARLETLTGRSLAGWRE
jgi:hypothetical protein